MPYNGIKARFNIKDRVNVRLEPNQMELLREYCKLKDQNMAKTCREAIEIFLKVHTVKKNKKLA